MEWSLGGECGGLNLDALGLGCLVSSKTRKRLGLEIIK